MRRFPAAIITIAAMSLSCASPTAAAGTNSIGADTAAGHSTYAGPGLPAKLSLGGILWNSISCPTADSCMAVGSYQTSGVLLPITEWWSGTSWSILPVPLPESSGEGFLKSVSCASAQDCLAVGAVGILTSQGPYFPLASHWNGTAWSSRVAATSAQGKQFQLSAVSCTAVTMCIAVGHSDISPANPMPVAERWDGATWSLLPSSGLGPARDQLDGLSCVSATACMAVGSTIAQWNGTAWTVQPIPTVFGDIYNYLYSVSCTSASACVAVGTNSNNGDKAEAGEWNGTTWTATPVPRPAGTAASWLTGVSCSAPHVCTAVGAYGTNQQRWHPPRQTGQGMALAERWNGTTWSIQPTPDGIGIGAGAMSSVSCASAHACTGVGSPEAAEQWNGSSWKAQRPPVPATEADLSGVSCARAQAGARSKAASCAAVGAYLTASGSVMPLVETSNGAAWIARKLLPPSGALASSLTAVSCPSAAACMTIGMYEDASGTWGPMSERWDGASWSVQSMPDPPGSDSAGVTSVSCASAGACTAVGWYRAATGYHAMAERWNGHSWTAQALRDPGGCDPASFCSALTSISCPTSMACIAVGYYVVSVFGYEIRALVERWDGKAWTIVPGPHPRAPGSLQGISCLSVTSCTVVGTLGYTDTSTLALAAHWNGKRWSNQHVPVPQNAEYSKLTAVSCPSANACAALYSGILRGSLAGLFAMSEHWNGKQWTLAPTPLPAQSRRGQVASISCGSGVQCIAVGAYPKGSNNQLPLVQDWNGKAWAIQPAPLPKT